MEVLENGSQENIVSAVTGTRVTLYATVRNAAITEHGSLSRDAIVLFIAYRSSIPP